MYLNYMQNTKIHSIRLRPGQDLKAGLVSEYILEVQNLVKTYPDGTRALKNVSFKVKKGEFLIIIGLSGSGKSTLLRCLNRIHTPTSGQILFNGKDIPHAASSTLIRELRRNIAMIFQNYNLISRHSVLSNVLMGRLGYAGTLKSVFGLFSEADVENAKKYLSLVGILEKAATRADRLSGGQQQRVAIARALVQSPQLLLADEPVASLDPATAHIIMDYLKKANQEHGITVIANMHSIPLVRKYATRVIALKEGEIVFDGNSNAIDPVHFEKIYGSGSKENQYDLELKS